MHATALRMLEEAKANRCEILLPIDLVVSAAFAAERADPDGRASMPCRRT